MIEIETKAGVKSSEFWLALGVTVLGAVASVYAETEVGRVAGTIAAALVVAGYGFTRASVKKASMGVSAVSSTVGGVTRTELNR